MKLDFKKYTLIEIYIFFILLSFNITNIFVVTIGNRTIHIHHIISAIFFVWTTFRFKRVSLKINMLIVYYFFALFVSIIILPKYGMGATVVNIVYCLMLFSIISAWKDEIDQEKLHQIIQQVGYFFAIAIVINLLIQWKTVFYSFESKATHLLTKTLVAGGANIEATFLATYACFLLYKKKYGFWIFSLLISILYSSRVAIILNMFSLGLYLVSFMKNKKIKDIDRIKTKHTVILLVGFIVIMGIMYSRGYFNQVIGRFLNIGKDSGSSARIQLWINALKVFKTHPFGIGVGNAITYANSLMEEKINLNNIHCVYLQTLVETGFVGFIIFLLSVYQIVKKSFSTWLSDPLGAMLLGYLLCSLLQFRGTEPFYILLWALFLLKEYSVEYKQN